MCLGLAGFLCVFLRMQGFFLVNELKISHKNNGGYNFCTSTVSLRVVFMFAAVTILLDFQSC